MPPTLWGPLSRIVERSLPRDAVEPALGDLLEEYEEHVTRIGPLGAELWLVRECLSLSTAYRTGRFRRRLPGRSLVDVLRADLTHAWRGLRNRRGAAVATVAVLTLGIGLVSAMFALADPYVLRPLPFSRAEELYQLSLRTREQALVPTLADLQRRTDLFAGVLAQGNTSEVVVQAPTGEASLTLLPISREYFDVLGFPAGVPGEWRVAGPQAETPVLLTHQAAQRIARGEAAIGQAMSSLDNDTTLRVVGMIASRSFVDPQARAGVVIDGFMPLAVDPLVTITLSGRGGYSSSGHSVIARLRRGVTPEMVEEALSTVAVEDDRMGAPPEGLIVAATSIKEQLTSRVRPLALGALVAGILILVVCAANVANLLFVRAAARTHEFASREALGAARSDIARLVLIELGLLTGVGVLGGVALAALVVAFVSQIIPAEYTTLGTPDVGPRVVAFAAASGLAIMVAGLVPGWAAWRTTPLALFSRVSGSESKTATALRFTLIAAQTSVAVVLLAGAVMLGRSYVNLLMQDAGYDRDTFAVTAVYSPTSGGGAAGMALHDTVDSTVAATIDRLRRIPGVTQVGASPGPFVDGLRVMAVMRMSMDGERVPGLPRPATWDFFEAAKARLVGGRLWRRDDGTRVAVVTESFANECCHGTSPVGRILTIPVAESEHAVRIVGVVKDVFTGALDEPPGPAAFVPIGTGAGVRSTWINYVIRSEEPAVSLAVAAEREIKAASPGVTIRGGATMRQRLMESVRDRSFATLIVVFFGVAAVAVSAAGVVGVVAFVVARRTREIAIRLAVGATASDVRRLVTRQAAIAAGIGAIAGLTAARWLATLAESLLYGIEPADPTSFILTAIVIVVVVSCAAWFPAGRATRLSPTVALRSE